MFWKKELKYDLIKSSNLHIFLPSNQSKKIVSCLQENSITQERLNKGNGALIRSDQPNEYHFLVNFIKKVFLNKHYCNYIIIFNYTFGCYVFFLNYLYRICVQILYTINKVFFTLKITGQNRNNRVYRARRPATGES